MKGRKGNDKTLVRDKEHFSRAITANTKTKD